jgi:hypothetical protein
LAISGSVIWVSVLDSEKVLATVALGKGLDGDLGLVSVEKSVGRSPELGESAWGSAWQIQTLARED